MSDVSEKLFLSRGCTLWSKHQLCLPIHAFGAIQYNTIQYNTLSLFPPYLKIVCNDTFYRTLWNKTNKQQNTGEMEIVNCSGIWYNIGNVECSTITIQCASGVRVHTYTCTSTYIHSYEYIHTLVLVLISVRVCVMCAYGIR